MKLITTAIFVGIMALSTTACAKEDSKKTSVVAQSQDKTAPAPKTKRICKDVIKNGQTVKNKDGSVKQQCRTIKIHKKHEGTKVPTKK